MPSSSVGESIVRKVYFDGIEGLRRALAP